MTELADPTDLNIIEMLRPNPRIANKEVAGALGLAETTVSQRIKSMAERNIMRVVAQKHVFTDGMNQMHFLFINTSGRTVQTISADIAELNGVFSVSQGIGNPDIMVSARTADLAGAHRLANEIGQLPGIATLEVVPCFQIHKMDSRHADLSTASTPPVSSNPKEDAVIHAFMRDGRQSNREVARQLGISEATVRQRLNKLLNAGQIQFQVAVDPAALSLTTVALLRMKTLTRHTQTILEKVKTLDDTQFVGEVTGTHNIVALTTTADTLTLGNLCDNELMPMTGVEHLDVQLLVDTSKHQYQLAHFATCEQDSARFEMNRAV